MDVRAETLLSLQTKAQQDVEAFGSSLSETEREATGQQERWSPKDLIAHISSWWHIQGERFAQIAQGNSSVDFAWSDEVNATLFTTNAQRSWEEVMAEMALSAAEWRKAIQQLKAEDLQLRDPTEDEGSPLWRLILGNGCLHPAQHLTEHYLERGETEKATQLQEKIASRLITSLPALSALAYYNLACVYAQVGRGEEAVKELGQALELDQTLRPIARQDKDFSPIQALPAFQALFEEHQEI
jgi:tetratricopeptide (TPR) repeat protein